MKTPLGRSVIYPAKYDPSALCPIPRAPARTILSLSLPLPFRGYDLWRCYELSWLSPNGCPQMGMCEIRFPCETPNIIESKSLKLYLGSFNGTKVSSLQEVQRTLEQDLRQSSGSEEVNVKLFAPSSWTEFATAPLSGHCIDNHQPATDSYEYDASLLSVLPETKTEQIHSHILRTVCPVTGQPDWATISIAYSGRSLTYDSLVRYLASFRNHAGFHEECTETIFMDLSKVVLPAALSVSCSFTRRGGIDITPVRYSGELSEIQEVKRTVRQ